MPVKRGGENPRLPWRAARQGWAQPRPGHRPPVVGERDTWPPPMRMNVGCGGPRDVVSWPVPNASISRRCGRATLNPCGPAPDGRSCDEGTLRTNALTAERAGLIARLQSSRGPDPNSFRYRTADHAVTLVIDAEHRTGEHAYRNALRNARSILAVRSRGEAARRGPPLFDVGVDVAASLAAEILRTSGGPPDPEQLVVAGDLWIAIERAAARCGPRSASVLDAMLRGDDVAQTAARLKLSDRQVKKIRARVRRTAAEILGRDEQVPLPPVRRA